MSGIKAQFAAAGLTNIPPTGAPSQAGLLVTKTFVIAGEGSGGQPILHAYDKKTGENFWQGPMPAGSQSGLPMTYMHQGKQYIVMATNGRAQGQNSGGAMIVAWAIAPPAPEGAGGRGGLGAAGAGARGAAPGAPGAAAPGARGGARGGQRGAPAPAGEPQ